MVMSIKNSLGGTGVVQELTLDDRLIDKLFIKGGKIKTYTFIGADYLTGLILRYSPKTQR